jgi:large subunit ribosomal protein L22
MVGVKTNERPGTRARASYVRSSAYKAREVLNLIRGKSCADAQDILAFSDRDVARPIGKVLDSALANAEHNDGLDADELYVSACYADEGPTLKRWRPRARGRATRIRKRTCHITVIVSRYDPETLENVRARQSQRGVAAAEARRRRVARSRAAAQTEEAASDEQAEETGVEAEAGVEAQAAAVVEATEAAMAADAGESGKAEEPGDTEESGKAEEPGDTEESGKAEEPGDTEESGKADGSG